MGFLDQLRSRATRVVDEHGDSIARGIDKAADAADRQTKGKYADQIRSGRTKAKDALDRLDGRTDGDAR